MSYDKYKWTKNKEIKLHIIPFSILILFLNLALTTSVFANQTDYNIHGKTNKPVKVIIHVTHNNKRIYRSTLNYIDSLQQHYKDRVKIEIVANGPGIGLLNENNQYSKKIKALLKSGVKISACNTSVTIMRQYKELPIINGVDFTPTGVVRVVELQQQGYSYLHP